MLNKIKTLASDTAIYGFFTIIGRFLTFLLTPIYAHAIDMSELGDVQYVFAVFAFINIINSFGMESAFFRFYSKDDYNLNKSVFSHTFIPIALISLLISLSILINSNIISQKFTHLNYPVPAIIIAAFIPFLDALMLVPYAMLRMTRQARRFAVTRFMLVMIAFALNILFVSILHYGSVGIMVSQLLASLIGVSIFLRDISKFLVFKFDKKLFKELLKFGLPTLPANFSSIILQVADRPLLEAFTSAKTVGFYTVNHRLGIPMLLFVTLFEYAWKPFYLGNYEENDAKKTYSRVLTYFTVCSALIFLLTSLFIDYIVRAPMLGTRFIPPEYWAGMGVIPITLAAFYFNGVYINFAAGFHITKNTKYFPISIGIGAIVNIASNLVLIPTIGYMGAAYSGLAAYFCSALVLYLFQRKVYPIQYEWRRVFIIIISAALVYAISMIINFNNNPQLNFIIRVGCFILFGVLVYAFGFLNKKELMYIKQFFKRNS